VNAALEVAPEKFREQLRSQLFRESLLFDCILHRGHASSGSVNGDEK
jgi:hypothetical protein